MSSIAPKTYSYWLKSLLPKTPLAAVIVALVTYLTVGHLNQQREYRVLREEIRSLNQGVLSQVKAQGDQLGQNASSLVRIGEQLVQQEERVQSLEDSVRLDRTTQMKAMAQLREELQGTKTAQADLAAAAERLRKEFKSEIAALLESQPELAKKAAQTSTSLPPPAVQASTVPLSELSAVVTTETEAASSSYAPQASGPHP